jgi:hypothetical protein
VRKGYEKFSFVAWKLPQITRKKTRKEKKIIYNHNSIAKESKKYQVAKEQPYKKELELPRVGSNHQPLDELRIFVTVELYTFSFKFDIVERNLFTALANCATRDVLLKCNLAILHQMYKPIVLRDRNGQHPYII